MGRKKRTIAMLLAGGQGSRLGVLTAKKAKPAVTYGGKYRIIDFTLSNCSHSGIDTVGVLTQYRPLELNTYIGTGSAWDLDTLTGGAYILPPFSRTGDAGEWYTGTANAIYQNIGFVEQFDPDNVLVLSGDHIYKMNYKWMLDAHTEKNADATIAVLPVPYEEASRFGIMNTDEDLRITEFEEKPAKPKSNLASMGVYVFKWATLKKYLLADNEDPNSDNDFGKNIIPAMLAAGERLYGYEFGGYWKDVGTTQSLWEANMELLLPNPPLNLYDDPWRIFARNPNVPPHYVAEGSVVKSSIVCEGCRIYGTVENSILSSGVIVEKDALVKNSIIMSDTKILAGSEVHMSIIDEEVIIGEGSKIGTPQEADAPDKQIAVIGRERHLPAGSTVAAGEEVRA
jgi:glucose-1-phosphate adenylyltransferase